MIAGAALSILCKLKRMLNMRACLAHRPLPIQRLSPARVSHRLTDAIAACLPCPNCLLSHLNSPIIAALTIQEQCLHSQQLAQKPGAFRAVAAARLAHMLGGHSKSIITFTREADQPVKLPQPIQTAIEVVGACIG